MMGASPAWASYQYFSHDWVAVNGVNRSRLHRRSWSVLVGTGPSASGVPVQDDFAHLSQAIQRRSPLPERDLRTMAARVSRDQSEHGADRDAQSGVPGDDRWQAMPQ